MNRRTATVAGFLTIFTLAIIVASTSALSPARAQDVKPPKAVDTPAARPLRASQTWQTFDSADGYTVWRKDLEGTCSFADHNYTLDVPADPNEMSDISYSMTNYDVDYNDPQSCEGGAEVDLMSLNGNQLGVLTGANNSWSINEWKLTKTQLMSGTNTIYIDTDSTGTGCWCVGVGYVQIRAKVGFKVLSFTPSDNDKNRDFHAGALDLTVTLSKAYKPASLNNSSFKLEYRDQGGAYQPVNGTFMSLAEDKFRFVPSADLKDGVKYRATVKGGDAGLHSTIDEKLTADSVWYFWTVPDLDQTDAFDYGSGSTCLPTASPCAGVEVAVFQVARNANIIPQKDAVARLYLRWKKHTDVQADDQVKELEVDASMAVDGASDTLRQTVKRPDQYSAVERQTAVNTINFYRTPATGFNYQAEVQPVPQSNATPVKFNKTNNLTSAGKSPNLKFDYYFLKDGDWSAAVPEAAKTDGRTVFNAGVQLITDQWPVLSTAYTERGEFSIGYTRTVTGAIGSGTAWFVNCPGAPAQIEEWRCVYQKLLTMLGGNPVVAATVPNGLYPGATAFALGKVFMHQSGSGANDGTVAHEMGHVFGISTANNPTTAHRNDSTKVEGFQVRNRTNHSFVENPTKSISLMHTTLQPQGTQWVDNSDYNTLLGTVSLAAAQQASFNLPAKTVSGQPADETNIAATDYLIVSGYVNTSTNAATSFAVFRQNLPNDAPSNVGPCLAQLLGPANAVLSSSNFVPGLLLLPQGDGARPMATSAVDWQEFSVSLAWNDAASAVKISCNSVDLLTVSKSPNAPVIAFVSPAAGATLSGDQAVSWTGSDADGNAVNYQLQASADGGVSWSPLTPLASATSFTVATTGLPSLNTVQLRVMATDGFNTSLAVRTVAISNPLTVGSVFPADEAKNIPVGTDVRVQFVSPLNLSTVSITNVLVLRNGFSEISGTLAYNANTHQVSFRPNQPLRYNSLYAIQIETGLQDTGGRGLADSIQFRFNTISDTVPPVITRISPQLGDINVPLNPLIQANFSEEINAGTLNTTSLQLLAPGNVPVPGETSYNGTVNGAVFSPTVQLNPNTTYLVRATTALQDYNANGLEAPKEWTFTTGVLTTSTPMRILGNYVDEPIDLDHNGKYDLLTIYINVEIRESHTYNINARLVDNLGNLIQWATSEDYLDVGVYRLPVTYDGRTIGASRANGPYTLDSVNFYPTEDSLMDDTRDNAYKTFAYKPSQFDTRQIFLPVIRRG